jgi:(1->4)-alpha-D-glucan 1-alpha-D-glucosylmutase
MPPPIPRATYRLQLTPDFGFDAAAAVVPYLAALGISHLYASPFLRSRSGSRHGYDVIDYGSLNPELGGEEGFRRLTKALSAADIGLILDFVPNHMAILHADNPWWLDVLEWGPASPYATFFDIDWHALADPRAGAVLIAILGRPYGEALEAGELKLRYHPHEGSFSVWYYEHRLPVAPKCYGGILRRLVTAAGIDHDPLGRALLRLAEQFAGLDKDARDRAAALKGELSASEGIESLVEQGLSAYRPSPLGPHAIKALHGLLQRQHYRLAYWRRAATEINYRRFFDINSLAGLRPEVPVVFATIHRRVERLLADGELHGLRIDHIDGLYDPRDYCDRLMKLVRAALPTGGFYLIVEKILGERESLPELPGVSGTTGYEWLNSISRVLLDERDLGVLDRTWRELSLVNCAFDEVLIAAKRDILKNVFASEFMSLVRRLGRIAAGHYASRDYGIPSLRAALELFILHFPVYRTYIGSTGPSPADRQTIEVTLDKARADWSGRDDVFDFLYQVLTLDVLARRPCGYSHKRVRQFVHKVQQFTGPMLAKSLEDTAFYRYHRLLALNEVGGDPAAQSLSVAEFHARMAERATTSPNGLTATATHDTKRGEDARTRLLGMSELANQWAQAVSEWKTGHADLSTGGSRLPTAAHEYMIYQALLGSWPTAGLSEAFVERIKAYAIKAAREGKQQTSWLDPDAEYEEALCGFLDRLLDPQASAAFIQSFDAFARRAALIGALKSLTQTVLKVALPGIPDFYQGTEFWDLSFVDPDNRRLVDFAARQASLSQMAEHLDWGDLATHWPDGRVKLALIQRLLAFRQRLAEVFAYGDYRPIPVNGPHRDEVLAFARSNPPNAAIVVVARLMKRASDGGRRWPTGDAWNGSVAVEGFSSLRNGLTGATLKDLPALPLSELFQQIPIAVLQAECVVDNGRSRANRPQVGDAGGRWAPSRAG